MSAKIIDDRLTSAAKHAAEGEIAAFQETVLDGVPSLRQVISSGARTFADLRPVLERAKEFRQWIAGKAPSAELVAAYYRDVTLDSWAEKLPAKMLRFLVFTGAGLALDAMGAGGLGTVAGVSLSAADAFVLDRLARGWKPNQFVQGALRDFLQDQKR